ncbi:MAG TPA: peptide chain release factor-like protein [Tepidisphaeraceae bacterium]|nr:peptide chain release factor-like protein [Tepidisphaeraceae bacterium]
MSVSTSVRFLSDDQLLGQCRTDIFRGSGPGGQKRNKTSNSIRLTHLPSGIQAVAGESRSQALNKMMALRRLRLKLSLELREPVDVAHFEPPDWFLSIRQDNRIAISHRHEFYSATIGLLIDLFDAMNANPAAVAAMLGVSTSAVVRLLEEDHQIWTAANRLRRKFDQPPLTRRR